MSEYFSSCTAETCQDKLRAIIQPVKLQDEGIVTWISSLKAPNYRQLRPRHSTCSVADPTTGKVHTYVKTNKQPTLWQQGYEIPEVRLDKR